MRKWWHVVPRILSPDNCKQIVEYAQTHPAQEGSVGHGGGAVVNKDIRVSTIRWLKRADPTLDALYRIIQAETDRANADFFGKDIRSFNDVQFTEYPVGAVYNWHRDDSPCPAQERNTPFDRKISVCIQLSDRNSYEGGEFWYDPGSGKKILGEFWNQGDMLIFPSEMKHKVTPVTEGIRYSVVTWAVGPR